MICATREDRLFLEDCRWRVRCLRIGGLRDYWRGFSGGERTAGRKEKGKNTNGKLTRGQKPILGLPLKLNQATEKPSTPRRQKREKPRIQETCLSKSGSGPLVDPARNSRTSRSRDFPKHRLHRGFTASYLTLGLHTLIRTIGLYRVSSADQWGSYVQDARCFFQTPMRNKKQKNTE